MIAFHNDPQLKSSTIAQVSAHRIADQLIKGTGWEDGQGCSVGCAIHEYNHARYEEVLGIPQALARIQDSIFEGLPNDVAMLWPERFLNSIQPGTDLSTVSWKFLHWLLTRSGIGEYDNPLVSQAVKQCADALLPLTLGKTADTSAARRAESAALSAARSAESARSAAWSAESAARRAESAESAALSAAWSAWSAESAALSAAWSAWSAESAARRAESAAWSAASAESAAWRAESAESAALSAAWQTMSDQLIFLLESANQ